MGLYNQNADRQNVSEWAALLDSVKGVPGNAWGAMKDLANAMPDIPTPAENMRRMFPSKMTQTMEQSTWQPIVNRPISEYKVQMPYKPPMLAMASPEEMTQPMTAQNVPESVKAAGGSRPPSPPSVPPVTPQADYLTLLGQMRDKGDAIAGQQRDNAKAMQPFVDNMMEPNLQYDLSPLLALTDSWYGTNLQRGYKSPESGKERTNDLMRLKKSLGDMGVEASGTELNALKALADGTFNYEKFQSDEDYKKQMLEIQRQQNRIMQAKVDNFTPKAGKGLETLDKKVAADFEEDVLKGGLASAQSQIIGLKDLVTQAGSGAMGKISGPDTVSEGVAGSLWSPDAVKFRQAVEQAVQGSLKATLGAQFTEREGKGIMARTYDPNLPPQENLRRLNVLIGNLEAAARSKRDAYEYYQTNGYSMAGYKGMANYEADFLNKTRFGKSESKQPSSQDAEAIAWAQKNPRDPRAAQILNANGIQMGAK